MRKSLLSFILISFILSCMSCSGIKKEVKPQNQFKNENLQSTSLRFSVGGATKFRLIDLKNNRIVFDKILYVDTKSRNVRETVTNKNGIITTKAAKTKNFSVTNFSLNGLPEGKYKIEVDAHGVYFDPSNVVVQKKAKNTASYSTYNSLKKTYKTWKGTITQYKCNYFFNLYGGIEETFIFPKNPNIYIGYDVYDLGRIAPVGKLVTAVWETNCDIKNIPVDKPWIGADLQRYVSTSGLEKEKNFARLLTKLKKIKNPVLYKNKSLIFYKSKSRDKIFGMRGENYARNDIKINRVFSRIKGSDWYFGYFNFPEDAFIEYGISSRKRTRINSRYYFRSHTDYLNYYNKNIDDIGKGSSFLIMPKLLQTFTNIFPIDSYTYKAKIKKSKKIVSHYIKSKFIGNKFIWVYLPPGYYKNKEKKYPVIYAMDGQMFKKFPISRIMDNIVKRTGKDFIFVMLDVNSYYRTIELAPDKDFLTNGRLKRYYKHIVERVKNKSLPNYYLNLYSLFEKWVVKEVVPLVDLKYRTKSNRQNRVIMGSSFGGNKASAFIYRYSNIFGNVISQSGFHPKYFKNSRKKYDVNAYISYGIYDLKWVTEIVGGFVKDKSLLKKLFKSYKVNVFNGGHKPWVWIMDFAKAIDFLFQ